MSKARALRAPPSWNNLRAGSLGREPRAGLRGPPAPPACPAPAELSPAPARTVRAQVPARGTPPSALGGARSPSGRALARAAVVLLASFPSSHRPRVGMATRQPVPEPLCLLGTRRCHRRSRGQSLSHDAPRQPSPQWAAMLSE